MIDQRPTKAHFAAMTPSEKATHLTPLAPPVYDKEGNAVQGEYPTMTGAELLGHRLALGLTHKELAVKLGLRGKNPNHVPTQRILIWEAGNPRNLKHLEKSATVPGPVALKVLALREGK